MGVVGEEHERGEPRRADRIALGHGFRRVAHCVERIGDVTYRLRQARHLGDAARIVGDWAVGIEGNDHAGHRQHRGGGRRDSVQADVVSLAELVGAPDGDAHRQHRQRGGLHGQAESRDHVRGMTGLGRRRHFPHRTVFGRGVVLGDHDHRRGQAEADQRAAIQRARLRRHELVGDEVERDRRDDARHDHALVEGVHDLAAGADRDEERSDDGGHDRGGAQRERIDDRVDGGSLALVREQQSSQHHRRHQRDGVGLEEVGRHAGAVAHVVTDVVGDDRGIARIVFGNPCFHLTDEVRADIGAFREDAAAETREDRNQRTAEGESDQRVNRAVGADRGHLAQDGEVTRDAEQSQANHEHSRDRSAAKCDGERRIESTCCRLRCADVRTHGDVHSYVTGEP